MSEPVRITTPEAAELLARPEMSRFLKPFMRGPKTVGEVAQAQGVSIENLHYRVQQFLKAGLLSVVGERPRRGRPIKLYEATATDFIFATRLVKPETLHELARGELWLREFLENLEHFGAFQVPDTLRVCLMDDGPLHWDWTVPDQRPTGAPPSALYLHTGALYLTPADAEALAGDLAGVYHKYEGRRGPKRYAMILGLTPMTRPVD